MLDQGQTAERAWFGAEHLLENHFAEGTALWSGILHLHPATLKSICKRGFDGNAYALHYNVNKFPRWLRSAAKKMIKEYDSDPRKIWNVEDLDLIYERFLEFDGIGDALAKMAQFILLRNYGIAGGIGKRDKVSVKPDSLVRRVLYRSGISPSEKIPECIEILRMQQLPSPADFDASAWIIGREFCDKSSPKCKDCPIVQACRFAGMA
jgi:endonuclease III